MRNFGKISLFLRDKEKEPKALDTNVPLNKNDKTGIIEEWSKGLDQHVPLNKNDKM